MCSLMQLRSKYILKILQKSRKEEKAHMYIHLSAFCIKLKATFM